MTDSQQVEMDKLQQNFVNDTAKLREQIWNKSSELDTLLNSETPDASKVKTLQKEINDLQAKMADKRVDFELQARKIAPTARLGQGYGRGNGMGYGMGQQYGPYGRRGPHYGQGYGPCWQ